MKCPECGRNHTKYPNECYADACQPYNYLVIRYENMPDTEEVQKVKARRDLMKNYVKKFIK